MKQAVPNNNLPQAKTPPELFNSAVGWTYTAPPLMTGLAVPAEQIVPTLRERLATCRSKAEGIYALAKAMHTTLGVRAPIQGYASPSQSKERGEGMSDGLDDLEAMLQAAWCVLSNCHAAIGEDPGSNRP